MEDKKLDNILRKIKGLLSLAGDNSNEEEAQSAFALAQKLMVKYNIESEEVYGLTDVAIKEEQASSYKTLYWYEKSLASVIAENFRVKFYYVGTYNKSYKRINKCINFYGLKQDVAIAKELLILAINAIELYASRFIEMFYATDSALTRSRATTTKLKNSYMRGFIAGLSEKLDEQRHMLQKEFGLVVLMPTIVEESYKEMSAGFKKVKSAEAPSIEDLEAYTYGHEDGKKIDYSKSTLGDDTF